MREVGGAGIGDRGGDSPNGPVRRDEREDG